MLELEVIPEHGLVSDVVEFLLGKNFSILRSVGLLVAAVAAGPKSAKDGCRAALANICGRFLKTDRHQELT